MSVDYKVRQIYNEIIHEVTKNAENGKGLSSKVCKFF